MLAAPAAAGVLSDPAFAGRAFAAFAWFCVTASGVYFVNDVLDRDADRRHERKRHRPIASGIVPVPLAWTVGLLLLTGGPVGGWLTLGWPFAAVLVGYVGVTASYSVWLKHVAVVDLAMVATGFVLRAVAGGVAVDVPLSSWFLIVASFGSLFIVAGKRHAEHVAMGAEGRETRLTLAEYTLPFLHHVRFMASSVAVVAYVLWAFEVAEAGGRLWFELSIFPFVLSTLRYALLVEAGYGEMPEEIVLGDRVLQGFIVLWLALFAVGVYVR